MKTRALLITTILSAGLLLGISACSHDSRVAGGNARATYAAPSETASDARAAAEDFVGHINYARIALARNNADRALKHVREARNVAAQLQDTTVAQRIDNVESGRVTYDYQTDYKYHYFPIRTGPVEIKKMSHGPVWAKNDLAVTDAEIVYLTVDVSGNKPQQRLDQAETDITNGHLGAADMQLARLTDETVTVDERTSAPLDKARDNIHLAANFVASGNYNGARYALKHADSALSEMQKDDAYNSHRADIVKMRRQAHDLQKTIARNDPTLTQKAGAKLNAWWMELKSWSSNS